MGVPALFLSTLRVFRCNAGKLIGPDCGSRLTSGWGGAACYISRMFMAGIEASRSNSRSLRWDSSSRWITSSSFTWGNSP